MKKCLFFLFGLSAATAQAAIGGGIGGSFIQNTNTLQPSATFYVSSGTAKNFNTTTIKFSDGSTQTTAAVSGGGSSSLQVKVNGVQISSPTSSVSFSSNFTGTQSPTGTSNIDLNPGTTLYIHNSSTLQSGTTFYVSSAAVSGPLSTYQGVFQTLLMPSTTEPFMLVNTSSHTLFIVFQSSGTKYWRLGEDPTGTGLADFNLYNAKTSVADIDVSTNDAITVNASLALSGLNTLMPVKTNGNRQLTSGLINVTSDITGTVPDINLPTNLVHTNNSETISGSKVFTASETFTSTVAVQGALVDGSLSAGTSGYILTSRGAGTYPQWQPNTGSSGGGYAVQPATVTFQLNKGVTTSTLTVTGTTITVNGISYSNWPSTIGLAATSSGVFVVNGSSQVSIQPAVTDAVQKGSYSAITSSTAWVANSTISVQGILLDGSLSPGTSSWVLTSRGPGLSPQYLPQSGGGGGGTPGGSPQQLQYNNSGSFGGISFATFSATAQQLTISSAVTFINVASDTFHNVRIVLSGTSAIQFPDGTVQVSSPSAGGGSLTGVTAGYGLSGGGTSGNVTLNLTTNSTSYIQNRSTLQSGSTAYPDFLYVGSSASIGGLTSIYAPSIFAPNVLSLKAANTTDVETDYYIGTTNQVGQFHFDSSDGVNAEAYWSDSAGHKLVDFFQTSHSSPSQMRVYDGGSSGHYVALKASATVAASTTWVLPAADGSNGQFMKTDGAGNLSFGSAPGVTGSTGTVGITIDGGGSAIVAGSTRSISIPYACTISSYVFTGGDSAGSISVHVSTSSEADYQAGNLYSISASSPCVINSSLYGSNNVATWTQTVLPAKTVISFVVDSASTLKWANLVVWLIK